MAVANKILKKPSGRPLGQAMGGGSEFYELGGGLAFFRDDFWAATIDGDEWDSTGTPVTGTGSIFVSAGFLVFDLGTSSTGTATVTSKDTYKIPFRVVAAIGVDGFSTGIEGFMRVRDTGSTFLAEWQFVGSAGGTEHTASTRVRAGSTAAGYIASAAVDPSAVVALAGSASLMYVIDCDYSGVTFAIATAGAATAAHTVIPQVASVRAHVPSPMLKTNIPYVVEFAHRSGTGTEAAGAVSSAANGSASMRLRFVEVRQYTPESVFQAKTNVSQVYASTTGTGVTAMLGLTQLKWG